MKVNLESADKLTYRAEFDAVFSNAALHWMTDASAVLARVHRALKPGGRFVAEMGGHGNVAAIRTALQAVFAPFGVDAEAAAASFFPTPALYRRLLVEAGFKVESIDLIPRPTSLPGGPDGMAAWLNTFRSGILRLLPPESRTVAVERAVALLKPILADREGNWFADYIRLRFRATTVS